MQSCYLKSSVGGGGSSSGGVQRGAATRSMPQQQAGVRALIRHQSSMCKALHMPP